MTLREARPVLKWAGGKRRLVRDIVELLPQQIETYYEPFVGGGAVFFALAQSGRFKKAVLADRNDDLLAVYRAIQEDVEKLIALLSEYKHSEREYYRVRAEKPRGLVQRAARIIYLNKTGYNGLYRVNRTGDYNVPFGRYKNPKICDVERLRTAASALVGVKIETSDFERTCEKAGRGDAVYFDPPYLPVSKTASFSAYERHPFGLEEHQRLARVFEDLRARRVPAVLSNSDTEATRSLFEKFQRRVVRMTRAINSKASRRGAVSELLVRNELAPAVRLKSTG
jgi:DNA adenine methylase